MEQLLKSTTAYAVLCGDYRANRLSHSYLLHFNDEKNLREALKIFSLVFYGADKNSVLGKRLMAESYSDCKVCPDADKKITAEAVTAIVDDSALRPTEGDKKLYIITDFEKSSALIQNKLLKTLEEPPAGVYFLLGAASLSPVLPTVLSRVKVLEIPPFSKEEIFAALERTKKSSVNARAAESCGGNFGEAQRLAEGSVMSEISAAAEEICNVTDIGKVGAVALKYNDITYRQELLSEMRRQYFTALTGQKKSKLQKPTLVYALERIDGATADLKFNSYFYSLLYDFMLNVCKENEKWLKLRR